MTTATAANDLINKRYAAAMNTDTPALSDAAAILMAICHDAANDIAATPPGSDRDLAEYRYRVLGQIALAVEHHMDNCDG